MSIGSNYAKGASTCAWGSQIRKGILGILMAKLKKLIYIARVIPLLNPTILPEAGAIHYMAAEVWKHGANDSKCSELGWISIPLAVEMYGCWGAEAQCPISRLASRLAIQLQCSKSKAITTIYQRLNLNTNQSKCQSFAFMFRPLVVRGGG